MTKQQIFNKVCKHLMTQRKKAIKIVDGRKVCQYRMDNGLMCAAGCLIPKKYYNPAMEGSSVGFCERVDVVFKQLNLQGELSFLRQLQQIHDDNSVPKWRGLLVALGNQYGLKIPECIAYKK